MLPRPSNAGRWVNCPASPRLEASFPDQESEDAREGTAAHWAAAQVLGGHVAMLDELTDRKAPNGVIITGEMVEHTQAYIDAVHSVTRTPVVERLIATTTGVEDGTPDAIYVQGDRGHLCDLKYGYRIVEAPGNWQLAIYAIAMFIKHQWALQDVTARIVQPRAFHPDGRVRSWTISRDDALRLSQEITAAAARTQDPQAPAVTGPHCHDCRALHACEAARRAALNGVDVSVRSSPDAPPNDALAGELHTLRRAADAIKLRLDAIEGYALDVIAQGGLVPGWSVERAFGRRKWTNMDALRSLEALAGVPIYTEQPVTPAAAERAGVPRVLIDQFTTTPETGRKLVARDGSAKAREVFK
jgi:hypothetical protein